jgi:concanavalin A-like lectin/glucanase superfamily protein
VRRTIRQSIIVMAAAVSVLGATAPANAAYTVRALWKMDSLPKMVDSSGSGNNGSTRHVELSGKAYRFNGKDSLAKVPDRPDLDPGRANIRLTVKLSLTKVPASNGSFDIVRKGVTTSAGGDYKLELVRSSSGRAIPSCVFKDSSGREVTARGTSSLNNKGFVTVTCTKTSSGVAVSAAGSTKTVSARLGSISNRSPVYFGGKGDGTDWFPGLIDQVKIDIG